MTLSVGSLFSGIGGFDLGLERAGMSVRWQVENDLYCNRVLAQHWPDVPRFGDIKALDGDDLEPVDVICGGFPCQPVTLAGRRQGSADARWLWPEFARVLRLVRPRYALIENVPGLFVRGFDSVLGDLAALGFDADWTTIRASDVGAPHRRERLFVVAYARGARRRQDARGAHGGEGANAGWAEAHDHGAERDGGGARPLADAQRTERRPLPERRDGSDRDHAGRQEATGGLGADGQARRGWPVADSEGVSGQTGPATSERPGRPTGGGDDVPVAQEQSEWPGLREAVADRERWGRSGDPGWWAVEPDVGRVAHGVPARVDRLRGLGNAIVPQVAEVIGRWVIEMEANS